MKINFNSEDKKKYLKLIDTKEVNIAVASMFMEYNTYFKVVNEKEIKNSKNEIESYLNSFLDFFEIDKNDKENAEIIQKSIIPAFQKVDSSIFDNDAYYQTIKIGTINDKEYFLGNIKYHPYQSFAYNDALVIDDDYYREISRIGYLDHEISFSAICKDNVIWMSNTPNEMLTIMPSIKRSFGKVITFGLGLGYYPFMCSLKDEVESITVVEYDKNIINLFNKYLLPLFPNKEKIKIIHADAYEYLKNNNINDLFDFAFIDIWHNGDDGLAHYIHFKNFEESKHCKIEYWLEDSIICMARRCLLVVIEEIINGAGDNDFKIANDEISEIINDLYFYFKDYTINSYDELHKLLSKESLINILTNIGKMKYSKKDH
jgi:hypothetical protein